MKAIALIDEMPETCDDCKFNDYSVGGCCNLHYGVCPVGEKADFCPLRPLPQKLKLRIQREWITDYDRYEIGYNACLDKITGETE